MTSRSERVRLTALNVFEQTIKSSHGKSEVIVRDEIASNLATSSSLFPDGWYDPPPRGCAVIFANANDYSRLSFTSLRRPEYWPRSDSTCDTETVAFYYVSPVERTSGIIGDVGFTAYFGEDENIRTHLRKAYATLNEAARYAEVGMPFCELYRFSQDRFRLAELHNTRTKTDSDPVGTNLGHSVPFSYYGDALNVAWLEDFGLLREQIRTSRRYINQEEKFVIPENICFTLEARLESSTNSNLPSAFFHFVIAFEDGKRKVLSGYENICGFL